MDNVRIRTAQNVEIDYEAAGLGDRVIAALIDYLLISCYAVVAFLIAAQVGSLALAVLLFLPIFLYFLLCEIFLDGQSIGKRVRNLKVARLDGTQPTVGNYVLRWLLRSIDVELSSGLVAIVTILVTQKGQRLGDLAAGTTVVRIKPRVELRDTILVHVDENYTPTFPQAAALSDQDIATAKEVLNTLVLESRSHTTHLLGVKMKDVLERKMGIRSDLPPLDFLRILIKDYNHVNGRV